MVFSSKCLNCQRMSLFNEAWSLLFGMEFSKGNQGFEVFSWLSCIVVGAVDNEAEKTAAAPQFLECGGQLEFTFLTLVGGDLLSEDDKYLRRQQILAENAEEGVGGNAVKRKMRLCIVQ